MKKGRKKKDKIQSQHHSFLMEEIPYRNKKSCGNPEIPEYIPHGYFTIIWLFRYPAICPICGLSWCIPFKISMVILPRWCCAIGTAVCSL